MTRFIYPSLQAIAVISMVLTMLSTFYMLLFMDMSGFWLQGMGVIVAFFVVMLVGLESIGEVNEMIKKGDEDE